MAAIIFTVLMLAVAVFQMMLAAGAPLGAYAWGGRHPGVLPEGLRIASGVSVGVCVLMCAVVLDNAAVLDWLPGVVAAPAGWVVFAYFVVGTVGNIASRSWKERAVMAPVSAVLAVLTFLILI